MLNLILCDGLHIKQNDKIKDFNILTGCTEARGWTAMSWSKEHAAHLWFKLFQAFSVTRWCMVEQLAVPAFICTHGCTDLTALFFCFWGSRASGRGLVSAGWNASIHRALRLTERCDEDEDNGNQMLRPSQSLHPNPMNPSKRFWTCQVVLTIIIITALNEEACLEQWWSSLPAGTWALKLPWRLSEAHGCYFFTHF